MSIRREGESLFRTLCDNIDDPVFRQSSADEFISCIIRLREQSTSVPVSDTVAAICADTGYEKYIRELGDMERFENLSEFKRIACEFEKSYGESVTLSGFINQISLQADDGGDDGADTVKLMTVHAAKGLEFPCVFVIGMSEGIFPSAKTVEERKLLGLEEERRLCYVAITRAERRLFLLDSEGFNQNGKQKLPSRFLKEIGEENYTRVGKISKELRDGADAYAETLLTAPCETAERGVGDTVTHPAFGDGEIIAVTGNSYRINFYSLDSERNISKDFFDKEHAPAIPIELRPDAQTHDESADGESSDGAPDTPDMRDGQAAPPDEIRDEAAADDRTDISEVSAAPPSRDTGADAETAPPEARPEGTSDETDEDFREEKTEKIPVYSREENFAQSENSDSTEHECPEPYDESGEEGEETESHIDLSGYKNLWKSEDVPKSGWVCIGISDLGEPSAVCEMCGRQIIRYVHRMLHPAFRSLGVGCVCAGKMEGDPDGARRREREFKSKMQRRENFSKRIWKTSRNSNSYLKIRGHLIVLYNDRERGTWKYAFDGVFCRTAYSSREEALDGVFEALENSER